MTVQVSTSSAKRRERRGRRGRQAGSHFILQDVTEVMPNLCRRSETQHMSGNGKGNAKIRFLGGLPTVHSAKKPLRRRDFVSRQPRRCGQKKMRGSCSVAAAEIVKYHESRDAMLTRKNRMTDSIFVKIDWPGATNDSFFKK